MHHIQTEYKGYIMVEQVSWVIAMIALYGTYLNVHQDKRGFYYWLVSNSAFAGINFYHGLWAQGTLFGVYTILAMMGIRNWKE